MKRTLRSIDLFSGAGGSSYGARLAGAEIVAGFDIWLPALKVFKANFPDAKAFCGDIRALSSKNIKRIHEIIGDVDLILASPECTNHSRAKGAVERSEESRRTAFEVIRFARIFNPRWIVIENVVEMGNWAGHQYLINELECLKYKTTPMILNSKDFGVPQSRERLFILCSLVESDLTITFELQPEQCAHSIISPNGKYNYSPLIKNGRATKTIESAERAIAELGEDIPFLLVYYGSGRNGSGGWQRVDEPLRTITTLDRFAYVRPGHNGHEMRMLQPEELKMAMGFNQDFQLSSVGGHTRRELIKFMGNGVCPPVMFNIIKQLTRDYDES